MPATTYHINALDVKVIQPVGGQPFKWRIRLSCGGLLFVDNYVGDGGVFYTCLEPTEVRKCIACEHPDTCVVQVARPPKKNA